MNLHTQFLCRMKPNVVKAIVNISSNNMCSIRAPSMVFEMRTVTRAAIGEEAIEENRKYMQRGATSRAIHVGYFTPQIFVRHIMQAHDNGLYQCGQKRFVRRVG
jgi:hypothetical protein